MVRRSLLRDPQPQHGIGVPRLGVGFVAQAHGEMQPKHLFCGGCSRCQATPRGIPRTRASSAPSSGRRRPCPRQSSGFGFAKPHVCFPSEQSVQCILELLLPPLPDHIYVCMLSRTRTEVAASSCSRCRDSSHAAYAIELGHRHLRIAAFGHHGRLGALANQLVPRSVPSLEGLGNLAKRNVGMSIVFPRELSSFGIWSLGGQQYFRLAEF